MAGGGFAPVQAAYRFYEDGSEAASVAIGTQNTALARDAVNAPNLLLRILVQDSAATAGAATDDWQLQRSIGGGAFADVTTSSTGVKAFNSASLTDAEATTNRLTGGTGSFVAGKVSEDGLADDVQITGSNFTEFLYTLTLLPADLAGAALTFRLLFNGGTLTVYTVTPTIIQPPPRRSGFLVSVGGGM